MSSAADAGSRASRAPLGALRSVLPYALAHKGRIAAALARAVVASAATLVVPVAVRRMIDFGFSDANAGMIRIYFIGMLAVVAVLAIASGLRYYFVMTLGERVVADVRGGPLRPSDPPRPRLLRRREDRRDRLAPVRRHDPAQGDVRLVGLDRAAQYLHVRRRDRDDGGDLAPSFRPSCSRPSRSSCCRCSRRGARCASARAAPRTRSPTRRPSRPKACRAVRVMQSFTAEAFTARRYRDAAYGAYEAARSTASARGIVTAAALLARLRQRRRRAVARRAGRGGRPHVRRNADRSSSSTPCSARARSGN